MDRRRAVASGLLAALLVLALAAQTSFAVDTAKCNQARNTLPTNPDILAFKKCAVKKPLTAECCRRLLPFVTYFECLNDPTYKAQVNAFLGGVITVDEAQSQCIAIAAG